MSATTSSAHGLHAPPLALVVSISRTTLLPTPVVAGRSPAWTMDVYARARCLFL